MAVKFVQKMEYLGGNPMSSIEHITSNLCTRKCLEDRNASSNAAKTAYVLSLNMPALSKCKE
jgi:hypothetical protein